MKYKAVGFDYGGVIAGIPSSEFNRRITELLGVSIETYKTVYFRNNHLLNHDTLSTDKFWSKVLSEMNKSDKLDDLLKFLKSLNQHEINNDILELARHLKTLGYRIGILSNNTLEGVDKMKDAGLMELFDVVAVSTEIGFSKPNPKAFDIFIEKLDVSPQELVFIDDTAKSLESAKEIGYQPVIYTELKKLQNDLGELGVL
ncbi:MAG: HAD-IA family hydrolase [Candidatus Moraniibacteriota bacterium]